MASGTFSLTISSSLQQGLFGPLDARADGELGVDVDLALVGLRQQLDADLRVEHGRQHDERRRAADDRRPVVEGDVNAPGGTPRPSARGTAR